MEANLSVFYRDMILIGSGWIVTGIIFIIIGISDLITQRRKQEHA